MTKPNYEAVAAAHLQRQGYESYYPQFLMKRPNQTTVVRPLFPRYMFILIDKEWYSISGTRGISRVLMGDTSPQELPAGVVQELRKREDRHGLVSLTIPPKFTRGARLRTRSGPLEGQLLIYEGMAARDRVKVLAQLLGRQCLVELPEKSLVAA